MTTSTPDALCERLRQVRDLIEDPAFITVATGFARYNAEERDLILRSAIDANTFIQQQQADIERLSAALEEARIIYVDDCFGRGDDAFKARIDDLLAEARAALGKDASDV